MTFTARSSQRQRVEHEKKHTSGKPKTPLAKAARCSNKRDSRKGYK